MKPITNYLNMKKYVLLLAVALVAASALFSCSRDDDENEANWRQGGTPAANDPQGGSGGGSQGGDPQGGDPGTGSGGSIGEPIEGCLTQGRFSVANGRQVWFSKGNLQYQSSTGTWRFAEHQYDIIGMGNDNISPTNDGWMDLFGWGTSGWNSGANCYQPYSVSADFTDFYVGGAAYFGLYGEYAQADWGVHNAISNGGNQAGQWRTLTKEEWSYVMSGRLASTVNGVLHAHFVKAVVCDVPGLILFPDVYSHPTTVPQPVSVNGVSNPFTDNQYNAAQWEDMEKCGCVFLPAAGSHSVNGTFEVGEYGFYYSVTPFCENGAVTLLFFRDWVNVANLYGRNEGRSVRLVRD